MKTVDMRPAFHGYSSSSIFNWHYERAWNTMTGAKRAVVARAVDLYLSEVDEEYRTVRFNVPANPDNGEEFLHCNKKNIRSIDDFFADNTIRNKHFRDYLEIFVVRAIEQIFGSGCCDILKHKLFPEELLPQAQEELDILLAETNSSYTEAVNEYVRVFRNGLSDDTNEELEILESK